MSASKAGLDPEPSHSDVARRAKASPADLSLLTLTSASLVDRGCVLADIRE